jgi:hypothetical protein
MKTKHGLPVGIKAKPRAAVVVYRKTEQILADLEPTMDGLRKLWNHSGK